MLYSCIQSYKMKRFTDAVKAELSSREFKFKEMPSMPSISMDMPLSINLGISESLSDAKASLSKTVSSVMSSSSTDKSKEEARKKQQNAISLVISLLEDVRLQCPQTYTGLYIIMTIIFIILYYHIIRLYNSMYRSNIITDI